MQVARGIIDAGDTADVAGIVPGYGASFIHFLREFEFAAFYFFRHDFTVVLVLILYSIPSFFGPARVV